MPIAIINRGVLPDRCAAMVILALLVCWSGSDVTGQQTRDGQPLEYIESSSPLPGGGTVTSIQYPGQPSRSIEFLRETAARPVTSSSDQAAAGRSVLVQSPVTPPPGYPGIAAAPPLSAAPQSASPQVMATTRVPTLGLPTVWNRSFRPGCASCNTGTAVYAPASVTGLQPPAAALPPALPVQQQTVLLPASSGVNGLPVQLRNLPPNAWIGQGVAGSPKLYVDGQPVRNLFRYIIP